jgi:hypothetical protein
MFRADHNRFVQLKGGSKRTDNTCGGRSLRLSHGAIRSTVGTELPLAEFGRSRPIESCSRLN